MVVGALAAAATTGALIAIGHRLGRVGLPFATIGGGLFHETANGGATGLIIAGILVHLVLTFAWSALAVWLVRARGWRRSFAAIAVAAGAHALSWIIAWTTGRGIASELALGDRVVLAVVFAGALVVGMRFAFSPSQTAWISGETRRPES